MSKYIVILLLALLTGCGKPKQQLNLFIWSEYIDPKLIQEFAREFDCEVNVDFYEDPDSMIAKLAAGGASTYDVVAPGDTVLPLMIRRGFLAPLRKENIPNLRHIDPQFTNVLFDPGIRYSAPLDWGTTGIYLRKRGDKPVEPTWGLLFDPAKQIGSFLLMDDARVCIGAALQYKGHSINTTNAVELAEARDLLIATKSRALGFEGGTGCKNRVLARGAALTMAYGGDSSRGIAEDPETTYLIPREGSVIYVDALSVTAGAPHRDLAEKFINYMLAPEVSARFSNWSQLATPNLAAQELLSPPVRNNPAIYPPPDVMRRVEYANDLGQQNQIYDELWTQIKAK